MEAPQKKGVPRISDSVFVGAGAKFLDDIEISENSVLGANAVAINSVDAGSLVVGAPAKTMKSGTKMADYT